MGFNSAFKGLMAGYRAISFSSNIHSRCVYLWLCTTH